MLNSLLAEKIAWEHRGENPLCSGTFPEKDESYQDQISYAEMIVEMIRNESAITCARNTSREIYLKTQAIKKAIGHYAASFLAGEMTKLELINQVGEAMVVLTELRQFIQEEG